MPSAKPHGGARTTVRVALVALVVLVAIGFVLSRISADAYEISPGGANPVAPIISIDGHTAPKSNGQILLTDVYLTSLNWLTWIGAKLDSNSQVVPAAALVDPGVSISELDAQGYLEMAQAKDSARVAALTRLGYHVGHTPTGAIVEAVGTNTPASGVLHVADVIVGAQGQAIATSCGLISALHDQAPGSKIKLMVKPAKISDSGEITYGSPEERSLTVGTPPKGDNAAESGCPGVTTPSSGFLGVSVQTDVAYTYPFTITISTPNIGGPSAGLAMTLGIIDQLSSGHLVHHSVIAATGTMAPDGAVGDVGGVPQKAIAVSRAGASLFLVPSVELGPARSTASSSLHVAAVNDLNQAISILFDHGGTLTMANGTVEGKPHTVAKS